jgi:hypothetical protein
MPGQPSQLGHLGRVGHTDSPAQGVRLMYTVHVCAPLAVAAQTPPSATPARPCQQQPGPPSRAPACVGLSRAQPTAKAAERAARAYRWDPPQGPRPARNRSAAPTSRTWREIRRLPPPLTCSISMSMSSSAAAAAAGAAVRGGANVGGGCKQNTGAGDVKQPSRAMGGGRCPVKTWALARGRN